MRKKMLFLKFNLKLRRILELLHLGFLCIVAFAIIYSIQYDELNEEVDLNNSTDISEEVIEIDINIQYVISEEDLMNSIIAERFIIGKILAIGHIGTIREGIDIQTGKEVAIKLSQPGVMADNLKKEYYNYFLMGADDPEIIQFGIPYILYFGDYGGYKVMVMKMLNLTLYNLMKSTEKNELSLETILNIGIQAINTFEYIHSRGIIVNDVRSRHIALDSIEYRLYIFDFASATKFSENRKPKNDLLSFGIILMSLKGIEFTSNNDNSLMIFNEPENWNKNFMQELARIKTDIHEVFIEYFEYLSSLKHEDHVDYNILKSIFVEAIENRMWSFWTE